jgi:hypothetical protein
MNHPMKIMTQPGMPAGAAEPSAGGRGQPGRRAGFTLTEMLISLSLIMFLLLGLVSSQLFGLKLLSLDSAKLNAQEDTRQVMACLMDEIRVARAIQVGTGSATGFVARAPGQKRTGNALQLFPSTNLNEFVRYYHDPTDQCLRRWLNGAASPRVLARYVTNNLVFCVEDFQGLVLTNDSSSQVISVRLDFVQVQYPETNSLQQSYKFETRIAGRLLE